VTPFCQAAKFALIPWAAAVAIARSSGPSAANRPIMSAASGGPVKQPGGPSAVTAFTLIPEKIAVPFHVSSAAVNADVTALTTCVPPPTPGAVGAPGTTGDIPSAARVLGTDDAVGNQAALLLELHRAGTRLGPEDAILDEPRAEASQGNC
jgi:hypothetical protein